MWNIPDQRVVDWADVHEMVTAVNFSPDGAKSIVGTMKGKCRFYLCANFKLEYETQIGRCCTVMLTTQSTSTNQSIAQSINDITTCFQDSSEKSTDDNQGDSDTA